MKFLYTLVLLAFISLSFNGYSQDYKKTGGLARLMGMGSNIYVADPFFSTINPAWNSEYDNFLMGDLGAGIGNPFGPGGQGQFFSANFRLDRNWTVGGMLTRNDFNSFSIALLDPGTNSYVGLPFDGVVSTVNSIIEGGVVPLDNNVELFGTYSFGNTSLGLGVAYASTSNDFTPDSGSTTEASASQLGFNLGLLTNLTSNFTLDAGVSLMLPSASYKPGVGSETKADRTVILVNARAFWKQSSKFTIVPVASFATVSGTVESGGTSADMNSFTSFSVGVGSNYTVGDFLFAGGLLFSTNTLTTPAVTDISPDLDDNITDFPVWNIGMEWNMIDWFVARLGYIAVTGNFTDQSPATSTSYNESVTTFFLPPFRGFTVGVGFRLGDFSLDATVNEDVLRQGLNNIGGGGGATFAYLSTSYAIP